MPPRGSLAHLARWRQEGQRQHITRWYGLGGEESSSTAIIQALSPDGETMPSRRHNQTDRESGKEATRLTPKRCWSRLFFLLLGQNSAEIKTKRGQDNSQPRSLITWCNLTRVLDRAPKITESLIECVKVLITMPDKLQMIP